MYRNFFSRLGIFFLLASIPVSSLFASDYDSVKFSFEAKVEQKANLLRQSQELLNLVLEVQEKLPFVEDELAMANLPDSLKYLPLAFNVINDNHRVGMWRLSYPIAVKNGMIASQNVDQRLDWKLSTKKAVSVLKDLESDFSNSTEALLAFVGSKAELARAKSRASSGELEEVFMYLSEQTQQVLIDYFAITQLVPTTIFPEGPANTIVALAIAPDTIELERKLHFGSLIGFSAEDSASLRKLNPTFVGSFLPASSEGEILVSTTLASRLLEQLDTMYSYQQQVLLKPKERKRKTQRVQIAAVPDQSKAVWHEVVSGDVLGKIAASYSVSVRQLKGWNSLRSDRINIGQKLIVYADPTWTKRKPVISKTKTLPNFMSHTGEGLDYTVLPGDTLWGISKKFPGISVEDIQSWNDGVSADIKPGQVLKIMTK